MDYSLTNHALKVISERDIPIGWVERVLQNPVVRETDPADGNLIRLFASIEEHDGRVLRVVINKSVEPVRVVSVFFDRGMRGKL